MKLSAREFNKLYPVGTKVILTDDLCNEHETETTSKAWTLGHDNGAVMIDTKKEINYPLNRIELPPIETDIEEAMNKIEAGYRDVIKVLVSVYGHEAVVEMVTKAAEEFKHYSPKQELSDD